MSIKPPGTKRLNCKSHWIAGALNQILREMQPHHEWALVATDDHTWQPDLFLRLLAHPVDIVGPVVNLRKGGLGPSLFHEDPPGTYIPYTWQELDGKTGLLPIDTCGGPLTIIRRPVLDAMGDPWFQIKPDEREYPHEDLYFFSRARALGFQPYVDLDLTIGHCFAGVTRPLRLETGAWGIEVGADRPLGLLMPGDTQPDPREAQTYHAYT